MKTTELVTVHQYVNDVLIKTSTERRTVLKTKDGRERIRFVGGYREVIREAGKPVFHWRIKEHVVPA